MVWNSAKGTTSKTKIYTTQTYNRKMVDEQVLQVVYLNTLFFFFSLLLIFFRSTNECRLDGLNNMGIWIWIYQGDLHKMKFDKIQIKKTRTEWEIIKFTFSYFKLIQTSEFNDSIFVSFYFYAFSNSICTKQMKNMMRKATASKSTIAPEFQSQNKRFKFEFENV